MEEQKFDPRIVVNAESSLALLSSTVNARIGNSKSLCERSSNRTKLVLRMRLVKLLFLGKNSRLKLELVLQPYAAKHVIVLNILGAKVTLTAQGSVGSAEANFSYHFSSREWEIGSKLGFIAGLGFKINGSY